MTSKAVSHLCIFREINFVDSGILGFQVDICKISLFMAVDQSTALAKIGLDPNFDYVEACFWEPQDLSMSVHQEHFPATEIDGRFPDIPLSSFDFQKLDIVPVGQQRSGIIRHRVAISFLSGRLNFTFSGLSMRAFEPEILGSHDPTR